MRSKFGFINCKSRGNIESIISILPQVAIFLISLQLISMQFSQSISSYIDRRAVNFAHEQFDSGSNLVNSITNVENYALIGGGKVRSTAIYKEHLSLISYFTNPRSKSVSVEIDEYSIN